MNQDGFDLSPLRQLVTFWRNRAEQLREGPAAQAGRAELFDACAAQLAIAIEEAKHASGQGMDRESLPLFEEAVPGAGGEPAPPVPDEGVIALAQARRRRPEKRG